MQYPNPLFEVRDGYFYAQNEAVAKKGEAGDDAVIVPCVLFKHEIHSVIHRF